MNNPSESTPIPEAPVPSVIPESPSMSNSGVKYLWEIQTLVAYMTDPNKQVRHAEAIVAYSFEQVLHYLTTVRQDPEVEIVAIIRREPVLAVLSPFSPPSVVANTTTHQRRKRSSAK